ncbi:hypothetical protein K501DRAFT_329528 [Backusella circina FSU 941]|nr:hypothetical protein K501DRAFT_329528 [Backusella circina FSU 941]
MSMMDPNLLFSTENSISLLSKSSPSQLQAETLQKANKLSHVPCKFFKQGTCTAGANCTFSHSSDISSESALCRYFIKGNCKFGTKCALLHTMSPYNLDRTIQLNERSGPSFWYSSPAASFGNSKWSIPSSFDNNNSNSILYQEDEDEINDAAMLPSSLNDLLFTPSELHSRRLRQQEDYYSSDASNWRVPFITKKKEDWSDDDDVQFFMEQDETTCNSMENTLTALFQNKMKVNQNNVLL